MHHFPGGLVYCCTITHKIFLLTFTEQRIYLPSMCAKCNIHGPRFTCLMVPLSVQHIDVSIRHQCTNREIKELVRIYTQKLLQSSKNCSTDLS